jgi:hypothetical protein
MLVYGMPGLITRQAFVPRERQNGGEEGSDAGSWGTTECSTVQECDFVRWFQGCSLTMGYYSRWKDLLLWRFKFPVTIDIPESEPDQLVPSLNTSQTERLWPSENTSNGPTGFIFPLINGGNGSTFDNIYGNSSQLTVPN